MDLSVAREGLSKDLTTLTSGTLLLEGPTLVGKTALLQQLRDSLRAEGSRETLVSVFTCSQSHAGYEPLLTSIEELSDRRNWLIEKRAGRMVRLTGPRIPILLGGIFRRFFPDAIPKEALDQLRGEFDAAIAASKEAPAVLEFPRSERSKLLEALRKAIKASGRRLVLLIDRIEELPTPGIKLLQLVAESSPANLVMVLSANSESTAYHDRQ